MVKVRFEIGGGSGGASLGDRFDKWQDVRWNERTLSPVLNRSTAHTTCALVHMNIYCKD